MNVGRHSIFLQITHRINRVLEEHFALCSVFLVGLLLTAAIAGDLRGKMWIDELITVAMAQQANAKEIVKATLEGGDAGPPLYAILVHETLHWVHPEQLAVRLPTTLGFCGMLLCVLAFCRRRLSAAYAFLAAAIACYPCLEYLTQGRGYGVVLGCAAGALLCWQAAAEGWRRGVTIPLLALCLAVMTATHYYAVFFLVPLFLVEMIRWRNSRRLDFGVLGAMVASPLVLALHYPLILASKPFHQHFWAIARLRDIPALYSPYLEIALPVAFLALFAVRPGEPLAARQSLTHYEWLVAGSYSLMPLLVLVVARYTSRIFVDRYILWAAPGIAIFVAALLSRAANRQSGVAVAALCLLLPLIGFSEVKDTPQSPLVAAAESLRLELDALPADPEPIVTADADVFMALSYYASPSVRERLIYPLERDLDLRYLGFDTEALSMSALSHRTRLHIVPYKTLLATYPRFIVAAVPSEYFPWHLVRAGYHVVPIDSSAVPSLYQVDSPGANNAH